MCCVIRGTQSQDYIAQSQEIDDHHDAKIAFKKNSTEKKLYGNKKEGIQKKETKRITQFTNLDYFFGFQKSNEFNDQVRSFWVNFLFSFMLIVATCLSEDFDSICLY